MVNVGPPILELKDATVIRGGVRTLDALTLAVRSGEHTAIIGPNGSGKSSFIRLLTLEDYPLSADRGTSAVRLFGQSRWNIFELRSQLGIVSGELDASFALQTRGGNVDALEAVVSGFFSSQGLFAHQEVTELMREEAREALKSIGALSLEGKVLTTMSAGEKRRVLIARALVRGPRALLLDEPTTGLDLVARHKFMGSIRGLARVGTTVILVTHHIEEIVPEIQRIVLLRKGRILCDGSPEVVLTNEQLSLAYGIQLAVERNGDYYHVRVL